MVPEYRICCLVLHPGEIFLLIVESIDVTFHCIFIWFTESFPTFYYFSNIRSLLLHPCGFPFPGSYFIHLLLSDHLLRYWSPLQVKFWIFICHFIHSSTFGLTHWRAMILWKSHAAWLFIIVVFLCVLWTSLNAFHGYLLISDSILSIPIEEKTNCSNSSNTKANKM